MEDCVLPNELLFAVFSHLDARSLERASRACRVFRSVALSIQTRFRHTYESLRHYADVRRTDASFDLTAARHFLRTTPVARLEAIERSWPADVRETPPATISKGRVVFVVCTDAQRLADRVNALAHSFIARGDYRHVLDTRIEGQRWCTPKSPRGAAPDGLVRHVANTSFGLASTYCADVTVPTERGRALYIFHAPFWRLSGDLRWAWMDTLADGGADCIVGVEDLPPTTLLAQFSWRVLKSADDAPILERARRDAESNAALSRFREMYLWDAMFTVSSIEKS